MFFTKKPLIYAWFAALMILNPAMAADETSTKKPMKNQESKPLPAVNPFQAMSSADLDYYGKTFSYAMQTGKANQIFEWRTSSAFGSIRLGKSFKSTLKIDCRSFSETFEIKGVSGVNQGYGCKRDGRDGWCKLREGNMLNCTLEPPGDIVDEVIEKAMQTHTDAKVNAQREKNNFWSWWPF